MDRPAPRLFVIPARDAPVAAVLRRGPSDWYQVLRWDLDRDVVEGGAWFHGRLYEERCDLSPDGELLLYFCHGGRVRPGYTDAWTAVSRLPWLHALALWPWGTTYGGGGRFVDSGATLGVDRRRIVLRGSAATKTHPDHPSDGLEVVEGEAPLRARSAEVPEAEWDGRDFRGRVLFAKDGKLFRRDRGVDVEIADLNGRAPTPEPAPEWARSPIASRPKRRR